MPSRFPYSAVAIQARTLPSVCALRMHHRRDALNAANSTHCRPIFPIDRISFKPPQGFDPFDLLLLSCFPKCHVPITALRVISHHLEPSFYILHQLMGNASWNDYHIAASNGLVNAVWIVLVAETQSYPAVGNAENFVRCCLSHVDD